MPAIPAIAWVAIGLTGGGWAIGKIGQGIDDASNGLLKLAVGGAVTFVALKKLKVI